MDPGALFSKTAQLMFSFSLYKWPIKICLVNKQPFSKLLLCIQPWVIKYLEFYLLWYVIIFLEFITYRVICRIHSQQTVRKIQFIIQLFLPFLESITLAIQMHPNCLRNLTPRHHYNVYNYCSFRLVTYSVFIAWVLLIPVSLFLMVSDQYFIFWKKSSFICLFLMPSIG